MRKIYLDNGSTSFPKAPGVGDAIKRYIEESGANINRGGYQAAYDVADTVLETRAMLMDLFGMGRKRKKLSEKNVVFVPSVTYGLNFILKGALRSGDRLVISSMEHNAVARPADDLSKADVEVLTCPCDGEGRLDLGSFEKMLDCGPKLTVINLASNVSGTLQDAAAISRICRARGIPLVLDASQAAGAVDIDFDELELAGLCVPGHKGLLGPQGIGAIMITDELADMMDPIVTGGTGSISDSLEMPDFLPDKFEPGTLNIPGIIGLNQALKFIRTETPSRILAHELRLAGRFIDGVRDIPGVKVIGPAGTVGRVGVVSLDFEAMDNADAAYRLESSCGIMTRCGLHCAPLAHRTMGTYPRGTVRFTFGYFNTEEETDHAIECIKEMTSK